MSAVEDATTLKDIFLFEGLPTADLERLNALLHRKRFPSGASILTVEQPGEAIYILLEGTVKIYVDKEDGTEVILALLGAGDTVGEMSLVDSSGHSASVITMEKSTFLWMDKRSFRECVSDMSALTNNLVRMLSGRLRLANEQVLALSTLDVTGRVSRQILAFAERYGQKRADGKVAIPLRLTQTDLAGLVGASRERVNHSVVYLKQEKFITVERNHHIVINDRDALANRCL
jgi:CRP/FNR family cyclic AMP-dependent transcriptional regulator